MTLYNSAQDCDVLKYWELRSTTHDTKYFFGIGTTHVFTFRNTSQFQTKLFPAYVVISLERPSA
jgi:hypothetical protein